MFVAVGAVAVDAVVVGVVAVIVVVVVVVVVVVDVVVVVVRLCLCPWAVGHASLSPGPMATRSNICFRGASAQLPHSFRAFSASVVDSRIICINLRRRS